MKIQQEGREKRQAAEADMRRMENELKQSCWRSDVRSKSKKIVRKGKAGRLKTPAFQDS